MLKFSTKEVSTLKILRKENVLLLGFCPLFPISFQATLEILHRFTSNIIYGGKTLEKTIKRSIENRR